MPPLPPRNAQAPRRRIGLIGAGHLGAALIRELSTGPAAVHNELVGVLARHPRDVDGVPVLADAEAFFARAPDLVIELAGPAALAAHGERTLRQAPLWSVSPSALADDALHQRLLAAIAASGHRLRILNGAIGALDAIATAHVVPAELELWIRVQSDATTERELFAGSVREAVERFPHNINIAAAAALAGPGLDRTRIRVLTPGVAAGHRHRLRLWGPLAEATYEVRPGTDTATGIRLTAASAIRALRELDQPITIG